MRSLEVLQCDTQFSALTYLRGHRTGSAKFVVAKVLREPRIRSLGEFKAGLRFKV